MYRFFAFTILVAAGVFAWQNNYTFANLPIPDLFAGSALDSGWSTPDTIEVFINKTVDESSFVKNGKRWIEKMDEEMAKEIEGIIICKEFAIPDFKHGNSYFADNFGRVLAFVREKRAPGDLSLYIEHAIFAKYAGPDTTIIEDVAMNIPAYHKDIKEKTSLLYCGESVLLGNIDCVKVKIDFIEDRGDTGLFAISYTHIVPNKQNNIHQKIRPPKEPQERPRSFQVF